MPANEQNAVIRKRGQFRRIDFLLTINRFHDEMEKAKAGKEDVE